MHSRQRTALALATATLAAIGCFDRPAPTEREVVTRQVPLLLGIGTESFRLAHTAPPPAPGDARDNTVAYLDGDPFSFGSMFRKNAATGASIGMPQSGGTAYFRDAAVSTTHTLRASGDGQTWRLDILHPTGFTETGPTITFRRNFNGETDCFLFGGFGGTLCGSELAFLFTTLNVQCANTGFYFIRTFFNGAPHVSGDADWKLVPRIPDGLPPQFQGDYPAADYDNLCQYGETAKTCRSDTDTKLKIRRKGCALTAGAMALDYWGIKTNPEALNGYLNTHNGYDKDGAIDWTGMVRMANDSGKKVKVEYKAPSVDGLRQAICRFGPQILEVKSQNQSRRGGQHFVLATGFNDAGVPIISDPGNANNTSLSSYPEGFVSMRQVQRPTMITDTVQPGIVIRYFSPGELVLTDPLGRRTGFDPSGRGTTYNQIPDGAYDPAASLSNVNADGSFAVNDEDPPKMIEISGNPDGNYLVDVFGTGAGVYTLSIQLNGPDGRATKQLFPDIPITAGDNHSYAFSYSAASAGNGAPMALSGAFSGGGQSSSADQMLTYARPGLRQSALPAGTTSYPLLVFYAPGLNVTTFTAVLNGVDVRSLFTPVPGGSQAVSIPLVTGRNVLKLTASGTAGTRTVSDSDNLIFKVP